MSLPPLYPSAPPLVRIALGSSTFGREIQAEAAFSLMDRARERGVMMFDTAATYTAGASETIMGQWLADRRPDRASLIVATKIYPPYTPAEIDAATAVSAKRLGVDVIDVLYLHKWDAAVTTLETLRALDALVRSGRVRALGASNFNAQQLGDALAAQAAHGLERFRLLQNNNNLAVRDVNEALVSLARDYGVAIVTYSPIAAGFLTGKHRTGVVPGSRFDMAPGHQPIYFAPEPQRRLAQLEALSSLSGQPMANLALAWALNRPGVSTVLIGGRGPHYVDQAFAALAIDDPGLLAALGAIH
ncbi:MAG: aldo/keto reductase [Verrucomicrobia bacterium]|nr:aldo/keto reductase [Verrucomicrobiota bacterium]